MQKEIEKLITIHLFSSSTIGYDQAAKEIYILFLEREKKLLVDIALLAYDQQDKEIADRLKSLNSEISKIKEGDGG